MIKDNQLISFGSNPLMVDFVSSFACISLKCWSYTMTFRLKINTGLTGCIYLSEDNQVRKVCRPKV